jgi:hypothetical protein
MSRKQILLNLRLMPTLKFGNNCLKISIKIKITCFQKASIKSTFKKSLQDRLKSRRVIMGQEIKVRKSYHPEKILNRF